MTRSFLRLQRDEAPHKALNYGSIDTALTLAVSFTNQREKSYVRESPSCLWRCRLNSVERILRTVSCHIGVPDHDNLFVAFLEGRLQEGLWDILRLRAVQELRASSTVETPERLRRVDVLGQQYPEVLVVVVSRANTLTPPTHSPLLQCDKGTYAGMKEITKAIGRGHLIRVYDLPRRCCEENQSRVAVIAFIWKPFLVL